MEDHFTKCVNKIGSIVEEYMPDETTSNEVMLAIIQVVADYAITEIKDLNLRTNEILRKTMETKNEQRSN